MSIADKLLAAIEAFDFTTIVPKSLIGNDIREIDAHGGSVTFAKILNTETVSIYQMMISGEGVTTDWRNHNSLEVFIFQKGEPYTIKIKNEQDRIVTHDRPIYIEPNKDYGFSGADGASISVVVSIPSNEGD